MVDSERFIMIAQSVVSDWADVCRAAQRGRLPWLGAPNLKAALWPLAQSRGAWPDNDHGYVLH